MAERWLSLSRCDRSMRWADVYVCMLADGVALRNRCPQGRTIAGGPSGVGSGRSSLEAARAGPHPLKRVRRAAAFYSETRVPFWDAAIAGNRFTPHRSCSALELL